jgi:hypothetical protein
VPIATPPEKSPEFASANAGTNVRAATASICKSHVVFITPLPNEAFSEAQPYDVILSVARAESVPEPYLMNH